MPLLPSPRRRISGVLPAVIFAGLAWMVPAHAANIPYSETFDDGLAQDFSASSAFSVQADGGGSDYQAVISSTAATSFTSAVQITNLGALSNFQVSTELSIDSFAAPSGQTTNSGVGVLADTSGFNGNEYRILYQFTGANAGRLEIQEFDGGSVVGTNVASTGTLAVSTTALYTLTVTGTYSGSTLTLDGVLSDGTNSVTVQKVDATVTSNGQFFGYRSAISAGANAASVNVDYDNFSVVPEPGSAAILLAGAGMLTIVRRRRSPA